MSYSGPGRRTEIERDRMTREPNRYARFRKIGIPRLFA
jgi:hypothetical protein